MRRVIASTLSKPALQHRKLAASAHKRSTLKQLYHKNKWSIQVSCAMCCPSSEKPCFVFLRRCTCMRRLGQAKKFGHFSQPTRGQQLDQSAWCGGGRVCSMLVHLRCVLPWPLLQCTDPQPPRRVAATAALGANSRGGLPDERQTQRMGDEQCTCDRTVHALVQLLCAGLCAVCSTLDCTASPPLSPSCSPCRASPLPTARLHPQPSRSHCPPSQRTLYRATALHLI